MMRLKIVGIVLLLPLLLGIGAMVLLDSRKEAASRVFLKAVELGRNGEWDGAYALTHPDYRRFAGVVSFRGDLSELTNQVSRFNPTYELRGGWTSVEIRYELKDQPEWGVFFELRQAGGQWRIADRGMWTSSEF
jgi:hypothetical protein